MKIRTKMAAFAVKSAAVAAMMAAVSCTKDKTDIPPPSGGNGKVTGGVFLSCDCPGPSGMYL